VHAFRGRTRLLRLGGRVPWLAGGAGSASPKGVGVATYREAGGQRMRRSRFVDGCMSARRARGIRCRRSLEAYAERPPPRVVRGGRPVAASGRIDLRVRVLPAGDPGSGRTRSRKWIGHGASRGGAGGDDWPLGAGSTHPKGVGVATCRGAGGQRMRRSRLVDACRSARRARGIRCRRSLEACAERPPPRADLRVRVLPVGDPGLGRTRSGKWTGRTTAQPCHARWPESSRGDVRH
jgi:Tfp pilus assembly protein PilZ